MTLQVLFAHTGQRLQADPRSFASLDAFKAWVAKHGTIAAADHVSLLPHGKPARFQALSTEKEVCVYDRRIVQQSLSDSVRPLLSEIAMPKQHEVSTPPDTIADQTDLQAWKDLFTARQTWASALIQDCTKMADAVRGRYDEIEIIMKCMDAAVLNFEKHVKQLQQKNVEIQEWVTSIQQEQIANGGDWQSSMKILQAVPVAHEMMKFMTGREDRKAQPKYSLQDFLDSDTVRTADVMTQDASAQLGRQGKELATRIDEILNKTNRLYDRIEKSPAHLAVPRLMESSQLMQDIEAIFQKISNDSGNVLGFADTSKNLSQVSKAALLHTRNFLPNLSKRSLELDAILRSATQTRNNVAGSSLDIMQGIAKLTSLLASATGQLRSIELDTDTSEAFQLLSMLHILPITYASFLAEAIRRQEWHDRIKSDSTTLANEMAAFQDEETRRRRRWQKNRGSMLWGDREERRVMGLEVNLQGEEEEWPPASKQDLDELLEVLRTKAAKPDIIADVARVISELGTPTKQQSKRAKAFKAGSIHEAALGRTALLLRGDDDLIHSLQEEKSKVESKLKTAESRVRRLEDLLHRHSQVARTSNMFQVSAHQSSDNPHPPISSNSPRPREDHSRRSSFSSRRFSANLSAEEKTSQQKLLVLEAELIVERERAAGLEKEVSARTNATKDTRLQIEELNSIKQDLLQNFEAQQREFAEERRNLELEVERLKLKLEEVEDELDRYGESREHERSSIDERVRMLQEELDVLRKSSQVEMQRAQDQVEFLRNDATMHREVGENLRKQLQEVSEERRDLGARAERSESLAQNHLKALTGIHVHLFPEEIVPVEFEILHTAITSKTNGLFSQLQSTRAERIAIMSDRDKAQTAASEVKNEVGTIKNQLMTEEHEKIRLREEIISGQARISALQTELDDERSQSRSFRAQSADGEPGSRAIQGRLEEEERRFASISQEHANSRALVGSLEEKLNLVKDELSSDRAAQEKLIEHLGARGSCAKDLTQRIYDHNERLLRLLERFGYSVVCEDSSMRIVKLPRPDRSQTANDSSDAGTTLKRSISEGLLRKSMIDTNDLTMLNWTNDFDASLEMENYQAFLHTLGRFDTEAFCEVLTKRIKDSEHLARKYRKEAHAYKDKSRSLYKEAHEKIAYKNFKEGDLALFLPTRNQATGAWAAFNVGAPHYFLREQDSHKLRSREWLLARIYKIEDRVVDLSKPMRGSNHDRRSLGEISNGGDSYEDDNPFDLSDGLRWYLIDAAEEKPGAPTTPGLGKSTVASANIDATGRIERKEGDGGAEGLGRQLKSLDGRRGSAGSKKSIPVPTGPEHRIKHGQDRSTATQTWQANINTPPQSTADLAQADGNATMATQDSNQFKGSGADHDPSSIEEPLNLTSSPSKAALNGEGNVSRGTSPNKRSIIWDSLWSLDLSLERGKGGK